MYVSEICKKSSTVAEMGDRLATADMGRRVGVAAVPLSVGDGAGSPSKAMSLGPRPTSVLIKWHLDLSSRLATIH